MTKNQKKITELIREVKLTQQEKENAASQLKWCERRLGVAHSNEAIRQMMLREVEVEVAKSLLIGQPDEALLAGLGEYYTARSRLEIAESRLREAREQLLKAIGKICQAVGETSSDEWFANLLATVEQEAKK
jgi:hypothetical protein